MNNIESPNPAPRPEEADPDACACHVDAPPATPEEATAEGPAIVTPEVDYFHGIEEESAGRGRKGSLVFAVAAIVLMGGGAAAYQTQPTFRKQADAVFARVFQGKLPEAAPGDSLLDPYKKALKKIDVRGDQIADAAAALGVDPTAASAEDEARLETHLASMTGGDPNTTTARNKKFQAAFGHLGTLETETPAAPTTRPAPSPRP